MEEVYQQFLAYIFMEQADQTNYASLLNNLSSQHALQNNHYLTTLSQSSNVLSNDRQEGIDYSQ